MELVHYFDHIIVVEKKNFSDDVTKIKKKLEKEKKSQSRIKSCLDFVSSSFSPFTTFLQSKRLKVKRSRLMTFESNYVN